MSPLTTHDSYPPFPPDVPTASLVSVPLSSLQASPPSSSESLRLFTACKDLGFFYLDLLGSDLGESILREAESLHELQQRFYALPHETKDEYGQSSVDPFYAYRFTKCADGVQDMWDRDGRREMYNLRVDDILEIRPPLPRPAMIADAQPLLASFAQHCREVVRLILSSLEEHLLLPAGSLLDLHRDDVARGDFISLQHRAAEQCDDATVHRGEHTDFGSITMLFNWLGGLQIRDQSQASRNGEWVYVKPIPGSCVINLADSLVKLTAGALRSNIHRVAPAPGLQSELPRYSLVYFSHPNDTVELKLIRGGLTDVVSAVHEDYEKPITAADWVIRRSLGDLRGVWTYDGGIEWRDLNDASYTHEQAQVKV